MPGCLVDSLQKKKIHKNKGRQYDRRTGCSGCFLCSHFLTAWSHSFRSEAQIDFTEASLVALRTFAERPLALYALATVLAEIGTSQVLAPLAECSNRTVTLGRTSLDRTLATVGAKVRAQVDLAVMAGEPFRTLALAPVGGRLPANSTIFAAQIRTMLTLIPAVTGRAVTDERTSIAWHDRTVASIVAVALALVRRYLALPSRPLWLTVTLWFLVNDVAEALVLAVTGADVMLTVFAIKVSATLAPLLTIRAYDALAIVALQVAFGLHGGEWRFVTDTLLFVSFRGYLRMRQSIRADAASVQGMLARQ